MSILSPLALLFGLLAIPVIALYLLRMRRRERRVSSVFLWREILRDLEANTPWQKLRPNLLLLLQLLVLALLVFSLARPVFYRDSDVRGDLILILDASAGMQAQDIAPTRFGAAQEKARELIDSLPGGHVASVILMGDTPELLIAQSPEKDRLRQAIEAAGPRAGGADFDAALSMAASLVQSGSDAEVVVLSDGNVAGLPPDNLPFSLRHELIGSDAANLTVGAFSIRRTVNGLEGLARVTGYGPVTGPASLELYIDRALYDVRELDVSAGEDNLARWSSLPEAALYEVRLVPGDVFPLDDRAWVAGGSGTGARALLVTEGNRFLEKALSLVPGLEVTLAAPESFTGQGDYDIRIFDGILPETLPEGAVFVLDPPAGFVAWASSAPGPVDGLQQVDSDLLRYVDISDILIREVAPVQPPPEAQVLLESVQGCLAAVWEEPHRRIAAIAFDLHDSDLPLQPAFPILVQNLAGWLHPGLGASLEARPGDIVDVPVSPGATEARVTIPSGEQLQIAPPFPPRPMLVDEIGAYELSQSLPEGELISYFAVNLFRPDESDLAPVPLPSVSGSVIADSDDYRVPYELAAWLALFALVVLMLEWWVYERGY